ncbi:hypothetical protein [Spirulina major]|uniref:hypothetical protein n=1 Tax=Spirulina major TaxID=270636 RepID=UPI001587164C|nr:hypothetical protein [Spirulina major]
MLKYNLIFAVQWQENPRPSVYWGYLCPMELEVRSLPSPRLPNPKPRFQDDFLTNCYSS